jgi:hypothetical protein
MRENLNTKCLPETVTKFTTNDLAVKEEVNENKPPHYLIPNKNKTVLEKQPFAKLNACNNYNEQIKLGTDDDDDDIIFLEEKKSTNPVSVVNKIKMTSSKEVKILLPKL